MPLQLFNLLLDELADAQKSPLEGQVVAPVYAGYEFLVKCQVLARGLSIHSNLAQAAVVVVVVVAVVVVVVIVVMVVVAVVVVVVIVVMVVAAVVACELYVTLRCVV